MGWNSTLTRKTPLRAKKAWTPKRGTAVREKIERKTKERVLTAKKAPKERRPMKRVGKRVAAWDSVRAKMKVEFKRVGITSCELQLEGCWRDNALSFVHSKKRRNIIGAEIEECALGCVPCHERWEILPEQEMTRRVRAIIAARPVAVASVL